MYFFKTVGGCLSVALVAVALLVGVAMIAVGISVAF